MKIRHARALRDRRIDRTRRIAQSLFMATAATGGIGVGLMSHAAATPSTTTVPVSGGTTSTTTTVITPTTSGGGKTTTSAPHTTTTKPSTHQTTTTVWTPPVTVPVTRPTVCHTSASGQFLGCW